MSASGLTHQDLNSLDCRELDDRVCFAVKAQPGARENRLTGLHDGALRIKVTQVAEKGKANQALIKVLAKTLGTAKSHITLESGETQSRKVFSARGLTINELKQRIAQSLPKRSDDT